MTAPTREHFRPFYILPGTRIGPYVVRDAIGHGGGQVAYLADGPDGREVVLKISRFPKSKKGSADWKMHERFMRQVGFFLELRGVPGVAHVFAHDLHPETSGSGYVYMVQEWVPGSLDILEWGMKEPHPLKAIVDGWKILANACGEMERRGICNRDLKPGNILVTPQGVPKIVDFDSGIAAGDDSLTSTGLAKWPGTKCYYSPELCTALIWDRATSEYHPQEDLHALGVILYELLTGEYPFGQWEDDHELFELIAYQVPDRPSALNPEVPFGLDKVTVKLLEKAPRRRYQSGDELVADLEALLTTSEDWSRPFQTPAREQDSTSSWSRMTSPVSEVASTPHTSRTAAGSAALNLAHSAIVLAGPSALAVRGPRSLLRQEPSPSTLAVAVPEVELRPRVLRRRALLLAAGLALAGVVPALSFGQHEGAAGSLFERGTKLLDKARTAVVAVFSMFTACVGPGRVGTNGLDALAQCPPDSWKAIDELALDAHGVAEVLPAENVIIGPFERGMEVRDGPVEVSASLSGHFHGYIARLFGVIRTGSDGATLHFNRMKLFEGNEPDDAPPAGREFKICAVASPRGTIGDLIPKVEKPPPETQLHPGFVYVVTFRLSIHFSRK